MKQLLLLLFFILTQPSKGIKVLPRDCGGSVRHVHLSVGPDPATSMIVSFASVSSKLKAPIGGILIGKSPELTDFRAVLEQEPPTSYNMTVTNKAGKAADLYLSPYYHHVVVSGLEPGTTYYYRPEVHKTRKSFQNFEIRTSTSFQSEQEMEQALKDADHPNNQDDDNEDRNRELRRLEQVIQQASNEIDLNGNQKNDWERERDLIHLAERQRELIQWPPYNGSDRDCPSPSRIRSFRTAPPAGSESVNLAIIGDLGQFPHSEETLLRLQHDREEIDAIILAGDIAYSGEDHRRWDTFLDFLDDYPIVDKIPLQICTGNHDIDKRDEGKEIFVAYENRFRMPRVKPAELGLFEGAPGKMNMDAPPYPLPYEWGNAYYSFIYGPAHVIVISAYSSMEPDSQQYRWIQQTLESVDRTVTPWLLVILHTPMYNTFWLHRNDLQIKAAREHLEPLFVQHRVNVVFTGHIHAYLRTAAVAFDELVPTAPVHITVGAGGRKCEAPFRSADPEPWALVRDATWYGYGMFRILNRTTAVWDWIHTAQTDKGRTYNEVGRSNVTLPAGPSRDNVVMENQLYL